MKRQIIYLLVILTTSAKAKQKENFSNLLTKGFVIFEKVYGDLNNDSVKDCILIIKANDKTKIVTDDYGSRVDRNRRGIIVLVKKNGKYEIAVKNYKCFSSENEDGGVYVPPELSIKIDKGNLYVHYGHGRYGYWKYTFKFRNSNFELIGYDSSADRGPIVNLETSINFLTGRKQVKENINKNVEQKSGEEIFKESWKNSKVDKLIKLSEVKDFDELDIYWK